MGTRKLVILLAVVTLVGAAVAILLLSKAEPLTLQGAVTQQDTDPKKQLPIANVQITAAANGVASGASQSDSAGFFRIRLRPGAKLGESITLQFRHPGYQELDLTEPLTQELYLARMVPIPRVAPAVERPPVQISNVSVRYSSKNTAMVNIGSVVKTLEIKNTGNVPCQDRPPCSPDGRWKAAVGSDLLDAGEGNEFRNTRVTCIAGPCPFTKIESQQLFRKGSEFRVSVRNWSDTTTFLLEAEVYHALVSSAILQSVPVIFGRTLNFSLPADAEGSSMVADVDKDTIVFPLEPDLCLSWANCSVRLNPDQSKSYRCELKPGYGFK